MWNLPTDTKEEVLNGGQLMRRMRAVADAGCGGCAMWRMRDAADAGCGGYGMRRLRDVVDAGCGGCGMRDAADAGKDGSSRKMACRIGYRNL